MSDQPIKYVAVHDEALKASILELQHERNELSKAVALANTKIAELEERMAELGKIKEKDDVYLVELELEVKELRRLEHLEKAKYQLRIDRGIEQAKRIAELEDFVRDYLKVGHTILADRAKALLEKSK